MESFQRTHHSLAQVTDPILSIQLPILLLAELNETSTYLNWHQSIFNKWSILAGERQVDVVAAHLRGMRPTPSSDKDILKPNGKLKTLNTTD